MIKSASIYKALRTTRKVKVPKSEHFMLAMVKSAAKWRSLLTLAKYNEHPQEALNFMSTMLRNRSLKHTVSGLPRLDANTGATEFLNEMPYLRQAIEAKVPLDEANFATLHKKFTHAYSQSASSTKNSMHGKMRKYYARAMRERPEHRNLLKDEYRRVLNSPNSRFGVPSDFVDKPFNPFSMASSGGALSRKPSESLITQNMGGAEGLAELLKEKGKTINTPIAGHRIWFSEVLKENPQINLLPNEVGRYAGYAPMYFQTPAITIAQMKSPRSIQSLTGLSGSGNIGTASQGAVDTANLHKTVQKFRQFPIPASVWSNVYPSSVFRPDQVTRIAKAPSDINFEKNIFNYIKELRDHP